MDVGVAAVLAIAAFGALIALANAFNGWTYRRAQATHLDEALALLGAGVESRGGSRWAVRSGGVVVRVEILSTPAPSGAYEQELLLEADVRSGRLPSFQIDRDLAAGLALEGVVLPHELEQTVRLFPELGMTCDGRVVSMRLPRVFPISAAVAVVATSARAGEDALARLARDLDLRPDREVVGGDVDGVAFAIEIDGGLRVSIDHPAPVHLRARTQSIADALTSLREHPRALELADLGSGLDATVGGDVRFTGWLPLTASAEDVRRAAVFLTRAAAPTPREGAFR